MKRWYEMRCGQDGHVTYTYLVPADPTPEQLKMTPWYFVQMDEDKAAKFLGPDAKRDSRESTGTVSRVHKKGRR